MARAVALQAIGLGFKSPYLQRTRSLTVQGKGEESARSLLPERQMSASDESTRGGLGREPWELRVLSLSSRSFRRAL